MADKPDDQLTPEDILARAKEMYARGSRNYLVRSYCEAADDLSEACELYADVLGDNANELGMPSLLYAKSLIALAQQGEHKVLEVPDEEEEGEDDDDAEGEADEEEDDDQEVGKTEAENVETVTTVPNGTANQTDNEAEAKETAISNGKGDSEIVGDVAVGSANTITDEPQPSTSSVNGNTNNDVVGEDETAGAPEDEEDLPTANLQVAWEVLEIAVKIFKGQGDSGLHNLADAYAELAEISLENEHFDVAIKDYTNSLNIRLKLSDMDNRLLAETYYKIGLCHGVSGSYDDSITAYEEAAKLLTTEIEKEQSKGEESDKVIAAVKDLEETRQEILFKITETKESKLQSIEEVKRELAKYLNGNDSDSGAGPSSSTDGAGPSSSSASQAKPNDISHLIKRKKPDTTTVDPEGSPAAKRPSH